MRVRPQSRTYLAGVRPLRTHPHRVREPLRPGPALRDTGRAALDRVP
ncbi:hypothetical protein [Streptosporangium sp. NPDC006007]